MTDEAKTPRAHRPLIEPLMAIDPPAMSRDFFSFLFGDGDDRADYALDDNGIATVTVDGPLSKSGGWFSQSYDDISGPFAAALADPSARAVVLRINSPGGTVSGCFDAVRAMNAAKAEAGKPVFAYADDVAYSAAYALASVADEIWLPPEGGVGSVGVIATYVNVADALAADGVKVHVIASGKRKAEGSPLVPMSKDAIARAQSRVDLLADTFAAFVAESRGMSSADVLALEAGTFMGAEGVDVGLADHVGNFQDCIAAAGAEATRRAAAKGRNTMSKSATGAAGAETAPAVPAADTNTAAGESLAGLTAALCGATGKTSLADALAALPGLAKSAGERDAAVAELAGVKAAAKAADDKHAAEVQAAKDNAARAEVKTVLDQAEKDRKLTPASRKVLEAKAGTDVAFARAFVDGKGPEYSGESGDGKREEGHTAAADFGKMSPMQRHELAASDPEKFESMRNEWNRKNGR